MARLYFWDKIIEIDNPKWKYDTKGVCKAKKCQKYRKECGYNGEQGKCLSNIIGHTCKHLVVDEKERNKFLKLPYAENWSQDSFDTIRISSSDKLQCIKENESVKFYKDLSEHVATDISSGYISDHGNIVFQGIGPYRESRLVTRSGWNICSFYLCENQYIDDYCLFNLLKQFCINTENGFEFPSESLQGQHILRALVFAGEKEFSDTTDNGLAERLENCLENIDGDNSCEEIFSCIFRFYCDSVSASDINSIVQKYNSGEVLDNKDKKCIRNAIKARFALNRRIYNPVIQDMPEKFLVVDSDEYYCMYKEMLSQDVKNKILKDCSKKEDIKKRIKNLKEQLKESQDGTETYNLLIEQTAADIAIAIFEEYLLEWYVKQDSPMSEKYIPFSKEAILRDVLEDNEELCECNELNEWNDFFALLIETVV